MIRYTAACFAIVLLLSGWTGCNDPSTSSESSEASAPDVRLYHCNVDMSFAVVPESEGEVTLHLIGRTYAAQRVESASGARYESDEVAYWSKGEEARLVIDDQTYESCTLRTPEGPWADAKAEGVDVRAFGNEPGWTISLTHNDSLHAVLDYGMTEHTVTTPRPEVEDTVTRYAFPLNGDRATLEIVDTPCHDTMKGDVFTATAVLQYDEHSYNGCAWVFANP